MVAEVHYAQLPPPPYNTSAMRRVLQAYGNEMTQLWLQAIAVPSGGYGTAWCAPPLQPQG